MATVLRFACYLEEGSHRALDLRGAYLIGVDGVPVQGEVHLKGNVVTCKTRNQETVGLSLLWPVAGYGVVQLATTRLPGREEPYHLHVELLRHRLMHTSTKREEWGLYDYAGLEGFAAKSDRARDMFLEALRMTDDPPTAARLADQALALSLTASEELCRFHAAVFLSRRRQGGGFGRGFLGAGLPPSTPVSVLTRRLAEVLDFIRIPLVWRDVQPTADSSRYDAIDKCVAACAKAGLGVRGGPVLNFGVQFVPDWMYAWENDYDAIFTFAREHVRRTVQRYAKQIDTWVVASGLHADSVFAFNFEQIIDLSRMAVSVTKHAAPHAQVVLDLTQPWGEYFARNQRTAPPLLYAEMAAQSGISFDAFGLQVVFGMDSEGFHLRDLLQISALIDRFGNLGRPLHITAVAVPSHHAGADPADRGWSERAQANWLADFCHIALSKPYVESVCLQSLVDGQGSGIPAGGVLRRDLAPKLAFKRLAELRQMLVGGGGP